MTYKFRAADPTQAGLRERFIYNPITARLDCNPASCTHKWHADNAKKPVLYHCTWYDGVTWHTHRLIWIYFNGPIPKGYIVDHIDRDKTNNHIENLRAIDRSLNAYNSARSIRNQSGTKGVYFHPSSGKWAAQIRVSQKMLYLGVFDQKEHAIIARDAAHRVLMLILGGIAPTKERIVP